MGGHLRAEVLQARRLRYFSDKGGLSFRVAFRIIPVVMAYLIRWVSLCGALFCGFVLAVWLLKGGPVVYVLDAPVPVEGWAYWFVGFAACVAVFALGLRVRKTGPEGVKTLGWRGWSRRDGVTALILLKVAVGVALVQAGYLFLSSDDFCRVDLAIRWSKEHWFAPWDHIWLAGQFYILGGAVSLLKDPLFSARLTSLAFSVLYALVLYRIADKCLGKTAALFSLTLLAFLPYPAWLSISAHPHPFFVFFSLWGIYFLIRGKGRWRSLFWAAVAFCGATMFRYEGILLGGVFVVWNVVMIAADRSRRTAKAVTVHCLICLIPFLYLGAWSVDCYLVPQFGDAFRFLRTASGMTPNWILDKSFWGKVLWYPEVLYRLSPTVVYLGLLGILLAVWRNPLPRKPMFLYLAFGLGNFVLLIASLVRGGGNVMAGRVVALSQVLLVPFAVYPFAMPFEMVRAIKERKRKKETGFPEWWVHEIPESKIIKVPSFGLSLRGLLVIVLVVVSGLEGRKTLEFPRKYPGKIKEGFWEHILLPKTIRGVPPDALRIAEEVRREASSPESESGKINSIMVDGKTGWEVYWIFVVMDRYPEKTCFLTDAQYAKIYNRIWRGGTHDYLGYGDPSDFPYPAEIVKRSGPYYLARFEEGLPKRFIERMRPRFFEPENPTAVEPTKAVGIDDAIRE